MQKENEKKKLQDKLLKDQWYSFLFESGLVFLLIFSVFVATGNKKTVSQEDVEYKKVETTKHIQSNDTIKAIQLNQQDTRQR